MSGLFTYIEAGVLVGALVIVLYVATAGALASGRVRSGLVYGTVALAWFVILWELARLGAFEGGRVGWRPTVALVTVVPATLGLASTGALTRHLVSPGAPAGALVTLQLCRLVSAALFIALAGEALPWWIAVPAGAGDIAIAAAAPWVARLITRRDHRMEVVLGVWTAGGMAVAAFLVTAVLVAGRSGTYFLTLYPLVLIPVFVAPAMVVLQIVAMKAAKDGGAPPPSY